MKKYTLLRWNGKWVVPSNPDNFGMMLSSAFLLLVTIKHPDTREPLVFAGTNLTSDMLDWLRDGYGVDELTVAPRNNPGVLCSLVFGQ